MKAIDKNLNLPYRIIGRMDANADIIRMEEAALTAARKAYAPYSGFNVGAAVLLDNNHIVSGSNQENAAYPSGLCAERTALFYAGAEYPDAEVVGLLIVAETGGRRVKHISPCGACRQVMLEVSTRHGAYPVYLAGENEIICIDDNRLLLPFGFDGSELENKI